MRTGDLMRVDLRKGEVNLLVPQIEIEQRRRALAGEGGYAYPASQTPWQEIQGSAVGQLATGAVVEPAVKYQRIARSKGIPRHNH